MNIHPPLSSLPFAFVIALSAIETWRLLPQTRARLTQLRMGLGVCAAVSVLFAFVSGYLEQSKASLSFVVPEESIALHYNVARLLLFLIVPCVTLLFASEKAKFNQRALEWWYRASLLLVLATVIYTGWLGGELIFSHGAGVLITSETR